MKKASVVKLTVAGLVLVIGIVAIPKFFDNLEKQTNEREKGSQDAVESVINDHLREMKVMNDLLRSRSAQSDAPEQESSTGSVQGVASTGKIDNRLVNANGEAWTHYNTGGSAGIMWIEGIVFHANGNFYYIQSDSFSEGTDGSDDWYDDHGSYPGFYGVERTGTWYTVGNKLIMIYKDGGKSDDTYRLLEKSLELGGEYGWEYSKTNGIKIKK